MDCSSRDPSFRFQKLPAPLDQAFPPEWTETDKQETDSFSDGAEEKEKPTLFLAICLGKIKS